MAHPSERTDLASMVADRVATCLLRHAHRLTPGSLLLACSGGADSTALALVAARLRDEGRLARPFALAHVDHAQHEAARAAAAAVRALAARIGCGVTERRLALPPRASEGRMRAARYSALADIARATEAAAILTAHHADDHLETVVMRMMRGTGAHGLAGIPEWRMLPEGIPVVRPLIATRRRELRALVEAADAPVVEDPTNRAVQHPRGRVRHRVLPAFLEHRPRIEAALLDTARRQRSRAMAGEAFARRWIAYHGRSSAGWRIELPIPSPGRLRAAVEVLRLLHLALRGEPPLRSWTDRVLALCAARTGARSDAGLFAERTRTGVLFVERRRAGSPPADPIVLHAGSGVVPFGTTEWRLRVEPIGIDTATVADPGRDRATVDSDALVLPLVARIASSGDRLEQKGQPRPVGVRHAMQRRHVPRYDRDRVPVVFDQRGVCVWAPGLDVAASARTGPSTRTALSIQSIPSPGGIALPEPSY